MKNIKTLLLASLLAVSGISLSACNTEDEDAVEEGATTIRFYCRSFEDWSNAWIDGKVNEFNKIKDDGIQVDMILLEESAYTDALKSSRENNQSPDIFMTSTGNLLHDVVAPGVGAPLNDLMGQENIDDLVDISRNSVTFGDTVYAWPQMLEPSMIFYYRKSVLQKAGYNRAPKTWAELLDACAKIKPSLRKGQYAMSLPTGLAIGWSTYGLQDNTCGHLMVNDKWDECLIDCQGYRDLAGLWYDLYAGGYCPAGSLTKSGYNDMVEAICEDKLMMGFTGSWGIAEVVHDYDYLVDDIGMAPAPTIDGNQNKVTSYTGGWTYNISSDVSKEHQQKAATFLKWLFCDSEERTASFFETACYSKYPVSKKVQEYVDAHKNEELEEFHAVIADVSQYAKPAPRFSYSFCTAYAGVLETCAVNCDPDKGESYKTRLIDDAIAACETTINKIINSPGYETNPYYEE